jgi:hypothetical protein
MNRHGAARLWRAPAERSADGAVDGQARWIFPFAPPDEERCRASLATLPAVTSTVKAGALDDAGAPTAVQGRHARSTWEVAASHEPMLRSVSRLQAVRG